MPGSVTEIATAGSAFGDCPLQDEIDILAENYTVAKAQKKARDEEFKDMEDELVELVTRFGIVPPHAESSRRLQGRCHILTVTRGNTVAINEDRVLELREVLRANSRTWFFHKLFAERVKHELVKDAETIIRTDPNLGKRLGNKVLALFGRCFTVNRKAPSLKVQSLKPKPAAKTKAVR